MRRVTLLLLLPSACGLSLGGTMTGDGGADDASVDASIDDAASGDGSADVFADTMATSDATPNADAAADSAPDVPCVPFDAGIGNFALSGFTLRDKAAFDENGDGIITLTNSNKHEQGAAWWPTPMPIVRGYDLTWKLRVGPNDTAGDGVTFAVIASSAVPNVGDDGDGLGLRNLAGVTTGYAVAVDMYKNPNDVTDLDKTTLKIFTMPAFSPVARIGVPYAFNDGNVYAVDVSWRAPHFISATIHTPGGTTVNIVSSDPGLAMTTPAYIGFTGATGGASNSHQEIAGLSVAVTCD